MTPARDDRTPAPPQALAQRLRADLRAVADPALAPAMQAYMKSSMPFLGVPTPLRRKRVAETLRGHACTTPQALAELLLALWRDAAHREERYAALDLLRLAPHRRLLTVELTPLAHELLDDATWWDFNDELSGHLLPRLLLAAPARMKPLLRAWARHADLWHRRAAMLAQRSLKEPDFDAILFYDCLLPSVGDRVLGKEFFICKGMGWALRERAYAAPEEVQAFCAEYGDRLSALTRREALRVLRARDEGALTRT
jgi:3-methyladenine DNA glycosylase AlkD